MVTWRGLRAGGDSPAGFRPAARDGAHVAGPGTIEGGSSPVPLLGRAPLARPRTSAGLSPPALRGAADQSLRRSRRPLVLGLGAALLFELSLLAGVLISPLFHQWMPQQSGPVDDATRLMVHWRQSVYHPVSDPRVGEIAPPLTLRLPSGQPMDLAALRGRKVALLFLQDGGT